MTSQVKIPYYPKVVAQQRETTFGAVEVNCPDIYMTPLSNMTIVRVDLLECLRKSFGDNCFIYRDLLYKLVSGSGDKQEHLEIFASFYRKYSGITEYVNQIYYFGETDIPIVPRVLQEVRATVDDYKNNVAGIFESAGGKYLLHTHDYLFYAFRGNNTIPDMEGLTLIC